MTLQYTSLRLVTPRYTTRDHTISHCNDLHRTALHYTTYLHFRNILLRTDASSCMLSDFICLLSV